MTIVVGVASPDGIVLAADSRTSNIDGDRHRIASDSAQKLFPIRGGVAVATYGMAFLGEKTIAGVMDEFVAQLDGQQEHDAEAIASELATFFNLRFAAAFPGLDQSTLTGFPLGFLVVGYDSDGIARVREVSIPGAVVTVEILGPGTEISTARLGVLWRGETDVVRRLVKGVDWDALGRAGVTVPDPLAPQLLQLEYRLLLPITVRDAVDFAAFLIGTTIEMQRFSDGIGLAPGSHITCGGAFRALSVTRAGVEWITDKPLGAADAS